MEDREYLLHIERAIREIQDHTSGLFLASRPGSLLESAQGRKLRTDTTVVESNIHYPTDSSLLGDSRESRGRRAQARDAKRFLQQP